MKKVILIDNGHGYDTKGKCSPDAMNGLSMSPYFFKEYHWCREIARSACSLLTFLGYDARLLVPEDNDIPLPARVKRVNDVCAKYGKNNVLLVSVHNNASGMGNKWMSARGWSIWTTRGITEADKLAEKIHEVARTEFKSPLKVLSYSNSYLGRDYEENFYILKNSYCPAVLIENFFQDNKADVEYLKSDLGKGSCIHVIVQGIQNYLDTK